MKQLRPLLILLCCCWLAPTMAQVSNYAFSFTTGTYAPITGGTVSGATGDSDFETIPLPFTFIYNGIAYDTAQVSTNGWMGLGINQTNSVTTNSLASTSANPILAPLWDDLSVVTANNGEIRYETIGTAPNRTFVVQWKDVNWNFSTTNGTLQNFQVRLDEATRAIAFVYGATNAPNNPSASIGINDEVGGSGHYLSVTPGTTPTVSSTSSNNSINTNANLTSGTAYIFTPPSKDATVNALVSPAINGCFTSTETITVSISNLADTVNFATDSAIVGVIITGPNAMTLSTSLTSGNFPAFSSQNVTLSTTYDMTSAGTYGFQSFIVLAGDTFNTNDTGAVENRIVAAPVTLPSAVDFTGFTGTNLNSVFSDWAEADDFPLPTGTTSLWDDETNLGASGNKTAKVNLYTTNRKEWIVGPKFTAGASDVVSYKVAVTDYNDISTPATMGSDDKMYVMLSTDCGVSWNAIDSVDTANQLTLTLTQRDISLASYAGQDLIVAFYATDGPTDDSEDYDLHLDDIFIGTPPTVDMSTTAVLAPSVNGCYSNSETIEVTIENVSADTMDFASTNTTVGVNITGPNATTLNTVLTSGTLLPNASQNVIITTTYDMTGVGTYNFQAFVNAPGDGLVINDTLPAVSRVQTPLATLPSAVDFNGFTGTNLNAVFPDWTEADDFPLPTGTTSLWNDEDDLGSVGNKTAKVNLYTDNRKEWIVGPKFTAGATDTLLYKVAVTDYNDITTAATMGSDDKMYVLLSADCGASWNAIDSIDTANQLTTTLTQRVVPLTSYAGQNIIIAFYATDGSTDDSEDYDLHIDDIFIGTPPTIELSATGVPTPGPTGCYTSNQTVEVTITNNHPNTIDFSNDTTTVGVVIDGPNATTLTTVLNTGTLASNTSMTVSISTTYDMSAVGNYTFRGFVSTAEDVIANNDTTATISRTQAPLATLPQQVDFTGFTGTNLTTVFPDWQEANTFPNPTGTSSTWIQQTNLGASGNVTARINLYTNSRKEWILGPKFTAGASTALTYKVAVTNWNSTTAGDVMGSDDKLYVFISADCGDNWTAIDSVDASNNLTTTLTSRGVNLSAYSGQEVIVGFYATDGSIDDSEDYDLHLDDINVYSAPSNDIGVIGFLGSGNTICGQDEQPFGVLVRNFGLTTQTTFPVNIDVTGSGTLNLSTNYNGSLPFYGLDTVYVDTLNTTLGGVFNFDAYTGLVGDTDINNDTSNFTGLTIFPQPAVALGNDTSICDDGSSVVLDAGAGFTYDWNNGTVSTQTVTADTTGMYFVVITDTNGCTNTDTLVLTVDTLPSINLGNDTSICMGSSITLDAGAGYTYSWNNGASTAQTLVADTTGNYFVEIEDGNNCVSDDALLLTVNALPSVALGADTAICIGNSVTLDGGAGFSYSWNGGTDTTQTITADTTGSYIVMVTNSSNCSSSDTLVLTVNALPVVNLGNDTAFCAGNTHTLDAGAGLTYLWNDLSTNQTLGVSTTGNYIVAVVDGNSCSNVDSIDVTVNALPTFNFGPDTSFCAGTSLILDGGTWTSYLWDDGTTTATRSVTSAGTYSLTVTDANGCDADDDIAIAENALPVVNLGNDTTIVNGDPLTLDGGTWTSYLWSDNTTNQTLDVTTTGNYSVTVTDANGCEGIDSIEVTIWPVGIEGFLNQATVAYYPNPTQGELTLEVVGLTNHNLTVDVVNLQGQVILSNTYNNLPTTFRQEMNLSELAGGTYFLRLQTEDSVLLKKVTVQ